MDKKVPRLIKIEEANKIIYIGDTHGDLGASVKVVNTYLKPGNVLVFLGDYVDRGPASKENIDFLLEKKEEFPNQVHLLMGNHEGYRIQDFSPADFWGRLTKSEYEKHGSIVENFPFIFVSKQIIALHGTLPDVKNLKEINNIKLGSTEWDQICWGDFREVPGRRLMTSFAGRGRPLFGRDWFFELMKRFKMKVLIRSHQPNCPEFMFNDRCLTIFTSSAYGRKRTIAIHDLQKKIKTARDLKVVEI